MTWIVPDAMIADNPLGGRLNLGVQLIAEMQQAQLLMVAGFVMLGWVLARRTIKMRKRVNRDATAANKAIQQIRERKEPAVPLCDAPAETQRWQVAMFDLQRELKAELDTRIVVVQTLLRQVDQRIEHLSALESSPAFQVPTAIAGQQHQKVVELLRSGHTAKEISAQMGLPLGDVEMTIATTELS
jgi:DNA-binding NarL/FixJ family response regulator